MRAERATRDSRHAKQTSGARRSDHVDALKALDRDEKNRRLTYEACAASAVRNYADLTEHPREQREWRNAFKAIVDLKICINATVVRAVIRADLTRTLASYLYDDAIDNLIQQKSEYCACVGILRAQRIGE